MIDLMGCLDGVWPEGALRAWKRNMIGLLGAFLLLPLHASADVPSERRGPEFDVPYFTGTITPTPKEATYFDEVLPLANTGLLLGPGLEPNDPRLQLLVERIERYGGTLQVLQGFEEGFDSYLFLGGPPLAAKLPALAVPDHAEAFRIEPLAFHGREAVRIEGRDRLGLLWAITAFNQLVHRRGEAAVWRKAEVTDFPDLPAWKRGIGFGGRCLGNDDSTGVAWFAVQFRLARFFFDRVYLDQGKDWRRQPTAEYRAGLKKIGDFLNPLGLEWFVRIFPVQGLPAAKVRSKSEEDFVCIWETVDAIAEAGGNVLLTYDDYRFPLHPGDQRDFGSARKADLYFLNKLYARLQEKRPSAKLMFCPPFYWGPLGEHRYPESRPEYLRALGQRLPKEVGILWTGPRVKSTYQKKAHVQWITDLIQRKPEFWQNGMGVVHGGIYWHYGPEPLPSFRDWYYDGFFDDIQTHWQYSNIPADCISLIARADALWNRRAYDPQRAVREASSKVLGPEQWPLLVELTEKLSWFDPYGLSPTPAAMRAIQGIRRQTKELEETWAKLRRANEPAIKQWTKLETVVALHRRLLPGLERSAQPGQFAAAAKEVARQAVKEARYRADRDVLLTPYDFLGSHTPRPYSYKCERRLATWIYGAQTKLATMRATFKLPAPLARRYELVLSAQDDDAPGACRTRILINDTEVFRGENPFAEAGWSRHAFPVATTCLRKGRNTIAIENLEKSDVISGPPFLVLNYAVLRAGE